MSNGEVKRWYLYTENEALYAVSKNQRGFVPDASTIEVMRVEDHERIVAELRAELKIQDDANEILARQNAELRAEVEAAHEALGNKAKEWAHSFETIAKQKRVIEKLREQRDIELEDNCWDDALTGGRPFEQARAMMDAEIEAIEKGS